MSLLLLVVVVVVVGSGGGTLDKQTFQTYLQAKKVRHAIISMLAMVLAVC